MEPGCPDWYDYEGNAFWYAYCTIDLRGIRPTIDEIELVEDHPAQLDAFVSDFMDDPQFKQRMVDFWPEAFLTRANGFYSQASDFGRYDDVLVRPRRGRRAHPRGLAHLGQRPAVDWRGDRRLDHGRQRAHRQLAG